MSKWETEFLVEQEHRPCICGICHKQIGTKTTRVTCVVTSDYARANSYNKFYHMNCILQALADAVKEQGLSEIYSRLLLLREAYRIIKEV